MKARNKMNETLLREFRGEEEEVRDENNIEGDENGISVERLEQLLSKVNLEEKKEEGGNISH